MFDYPFWLKYLDVFDGVRILARAEEVSSVPEDWHRVDGPGVTLTPIPYYVGPLQYLLRYRAVRRAILAVIRRADAVILRVPSEIAATIHPILLEDRHPYGVEVVGDPYEVFSPGAMKHGLRPFLRWWFHWNLCRQCARACAASYVTNGVLQRRYRANPEAFTIACSDVEIGEESILSKVRTGKPLDSPTVTFVGSLQQPYKGVDVLIDALAECIKNEVDLHLVVVGDGQYRAALQTHADRLGLSDRVTFTGQIAKGIAVADMLDRADLFVLPSRTEGLPRAMIEAMARGLPCIGTSVGGIPELLASDDMVSPGDVTALAQKIQEVLLDAERMTHMSRSNLEKARDFTKEALKDRCIRFYKYVRDATESWQDQLREV